MKKEINKNKILKKKDLKSKQLAKDLGKITKLA